MKLPIILLVNFVMGFISAPICCLAGWFGPSNYEECILDRMKGQDKALIRVARVACLKDFPVNKGDASYDPKQLTLNARCDDDGFLRGVFFNNDPSTTITQITVEIVVSAETKANPLFKYKQIPRFINIEVFAQPNSLSSDFAVDTGGEANSNVCDNLLIVKARGYK